LWFADINNYIELGAGVSSAPLQLYYQPGADKPEAFAWLTQPGIYYGSFNWDTSQHKRELDHLTHHRLLPYSSSRTEAAVLPLAVVRMLLHWPRMHQVLHDCRPCVLATVLPCLVFVRSGSGAVLAA